MGVQLAELYEGVRVKGGLSAVAKLAVKVKIRSSEAKKIEDSPENIAKVKEAIQSWGL